MLCLFAQPGELVLIEQPELHLHPGPQQVLGDFLLGIAESGRQLIVETHSEYLINRLRLRVVEDEFGATQDLVRIWYATRTDGRTHFKALEPDRFGSFDEWPEGFFDQSPRESEAILRAIASKRSAARVAPEEPTLHGAIEQVLREHGNEPTTARELADEINERGLYRKRDGSPVQENQIHARVSKHGSTFEKVEGLLRLVGE